MSDEPDARPEPAAEAEPALVPQASARRLTEAELAELAGYEDLREAMRAARNDSGASQLDIAALLDIGQSEVSRLETSIGPGSRIGRIKRYLAACGAELQLVVRTKAGQVHSVWAPAGAALPQAPQVSEQSYVVVNAAPDTELVKMVLTMEDSLQDVGITGSQSRQFRDSFFRNLRHYQSIGERVRLVEEPAAARARTAAGLPEKA